VGLADNGIPVAPTFTDPSSFAEQCWRHGPAVHAYLNRRAGRQVADDLFGEVWLQAFKARATYDHRHPDPRPWLYGIARHTLAAHWRRRDRPEHALAALSTSTAEPWAEADADARMDAENQGAELSRGLALLSTEEREVLLLVAWERLTPADAALVLGIPQGTARSRLHRARHVLRHEVASPFTTKEATP
jgi:RNA polymerase sigma-70 factor (ECF subfamily)